jgi:prolipoprotein diacylglyceryl transferase
LFASIPSPSDGVLHIGPIPLHAYGLMLALGVVVAVKLSEPRVVRRGFPEGLVGELATKLVVAGVIGARVYHLFTGYDWSEKGLIGTVKIWEGGLSIWGAVAGGAIALVVIAKKRNLDTLLLCDALAPTVAVAQGIGRWGNWFNQELFGRPTTLPWGLEIDLAHRPAGYEQYQTFHPTFLYESLWCFAIFGIIVALERRGKLMRGQSFTLYVALYTFERFFMELMRIDDATKIFGMRFNALLSAVLCVVAVGFFVRFGTRGQPQYLAPEAAPADGVDPIPQP